MTVPLEQDSGVSPEQVVGSAVAVARRAASGARERREIMIVDELVECRNNRKQCLHPALLYVHLVAIALSRAPLTISWASRSSSILARHWSDHLSNEGGRGRITERALGTKVPSCGEARPLRGGRTRQLKRSADQWMRHGTKSRE